MRARRLLLAGLAGAALAAGCGAPDELESDDDERVVRAREEVDDALDTEEGIRTDPALARRLVRQVQRAAGDGDAQRLEEIAPALVNRDGEIDQNAVDDFVRNATTDAPDALLRPATDAVDEITGVIDDSGADADTKVPSERDVPLGNYVDSIVRDIEDVWPNLADELGGAL